MNRALLSLLSAALVACTSKSDSALPAAVVNHLGSAPSDSFIVRVFQAAIGEQPRLGWFLPGERFLARGRYPRITIYGAPQLPDSAAFLQPVTSEQQRDLRREHFVACEPHDTLALYSMPARPERPGRALYTSRALAGSRTAGVVSVPLADSARAAIGRRLGWSAPQSQRRDTAVAVRAGGAWYSFHAWYDSVASPEAGGNELRGAALLLHDSTGRVVALLAMDTTAFQCADCGAPIQADGFGRIFGVLNLFELPGFPWPLLLLDTSTIEGSALSLVTFTAEGAYSELRDYEYTMNCGDG